MQDGDYLDDLIKLLLRDIKPDVKCIGRQSTDTLGGKGNQVMVWLQDWLLFDFLLLLL